MSDAFHIFSMNEVVTSLSYNIYRGQIHVIANPKKIKKKKSLWFEKEKNKYKNCQMTQKLRSAKKLFHHYSNLDGMSIQTRQSHKIKEKRKKMFFKETLKSFYPFK